MAAYKARLSPAAHRSRAIAADADQVAAVSLPEETLLSISSDAREAVLSHLNAAELCQCQLVCRALHTAAAADSLWRQLCARTWPETEAAAWLSPSGHGRSSDGRLDEGAAFSNYRQLYPALLRFNSFVGVWREPLSETPSLYCFRWGRGCIEGSRLTYSPGPGGPQASLLRRIFDDNGVFQIEHLTATECTLAMPPPMPWHGRPLHKSPSQEAQAAAAVANNRAADAAVFGTSPKGSLYHEMTHWMESNIAKPRRRNSRGSLRNRQSPPPPERQHLLRVQRSMPSRKHPLAGLWQGADFDLVNYRVMIVSLAYDFSGGAARIVASPIQVSRHPHVSDKPIWTATAAPIREEHHQFLDDLYEIDSNSDRPQREIISYHKAEKQPSHTAGSNGPAVLVVYDDGGISFFWSGVEPIVVDYTRIDADFP